MDSWPHRTQDFVDSVAASVAIVGRSESGELVVTACNDTFMNMSGGARGNIRSLPVALDFFLPSYARHELHRKLRERFDTGVAQELEQAYDLREGTRWWRLSLKPFRHSGGSDPIVEILLTGLDITPKMLLTHELELSTSRFQSVVDAALDAIIP